MQQRFRGIGFSCKKLFKGAVMLIVGCGMENKFRVKSISKDQLQLRKQ
jgi:hypothetical protein